MPKRTLKERREMLGLTQAVLADRARLKPYDVSAVETGRDDKGQRAAKVRRALIAQDLINRRWRHEAARITRQRAVWSDLPDCRAKERLIELLSDAAWQMLDGGCCEDADHILFILPEPIAAKLLDDFFGDPNAG